MRATPALLALLVATAAFAALAPAAEAKPYCTYGESRCPGLVCVYATQTCVDDCIFTCAAAQAAGPAVGCVTLYSGPFSRGELCVDLSQAPKCPVYVDTYFMGETDRTCYPVDSKAAAAPTCTHLVAGYGWDSYFCFDVKGAPFCAAWTETRWAEGGHSRKTCIPNLPTDVPPGVEDVLALAGPECYEIHREYEAGPVTVVQRSSCEYEVYYNGEPILQ